MNDERDIDETARRVFGYDDLRDDQREAIAAVVAGRDTLVVMPTGSGKSAIYQIAGLLVPGPTVIVSPLLALQRDQVQSLEDHDVEDAGQASSAVSEGERRDALNGLGEGALEFLFLAPEQFGDEEAFESVRQAEPSLFVVDEAHCISTWGHDFRPDYLRLGGIIEAVGRPIVLALTATAAPPVRTEIVRQLGMRDPKVVVSGFDRPNLWLEVHRFHDEDRKSEAVVERATAATPPGIVYAATRRATEEIAEALAERGLRARPYHAGLANGQRQETQDAFMSGDIDVVVATVAFGMGIDKPDVRFVLHHDVPASLDSYYQEIGRAGRDGEPADAVLFYRAEDLVRSRFLSARGRLSEEQLRAVAETVTTAGDEITVEDIATGIDVSAGKVRTALGLLEQAGVVQTMPGDRARAVGNGPRLEAAVEQLAATEEAAESVEGSRVEMMRSYAEGRSCRRELILSYFGEPYTAPCDRCDRCAGEPAQEDDGAAEKRPFPLSSRVVHDAWGEGTVVRYDGDDTLVVLFDEVGYKTLAVDLVVDGGLLTPA